MIVGSHVEVAQADLPASHMNNNNTSTLPTATVIYVPVAAAAPAVEVMGKSVRSAGDLAQFSSLRMETHMQHTEAGLVNYRVRTDGASDASLEVRQGAVSCCALCLHCVVCCVPGMQFQLHTVESPGHRIAEFDIPSHCCCLPPGLYVYETDTVQSVRRQVGTVIYAPCCRRDVTYKTLRGDVLGSTDFELNTTGQLASRGATRVIKASGGFCEMEISDTRKPGLSADEKLLLLAALVIIGKTGLKKKRERA